jgi:hypothetical protein
MCKLPNPLKTPLNYRMRGEDCEERRVDGRRRQN